MMEKYVFDGLVMIAFMVICYLVYAQIAEAAAVEQRYYDTFDEFFESHVCIPKDKGCFWQGQWFANCSFLDDNPMYLLNGTKGSASGNYTGQRIS